MKNNKTNKAVKAAFPIFVLFGGNALASNRGSSVLISSKKGKNNSIIYVDDINTAPELPEIKANQKSPFAVFTNNANVIASTGKSQVDSSCLDFLKKNELMGSSTTVISKVSGDTVNNSSKSLSHQLTNLTVSIFISSAPMNMNMCVNPADSFLVSGVRENCKGKINGVIETLSSLAACSAKHNVCMGNNANHTHANSLPVELEAFEVE